MRYSKEESTYILAVFNSGDVVTINIWKLSDDTKVVDSASCSEIGNTGVFKYEFSQTVTQKEEYLWEMSNGSYKKYGKIVLGGYMDNINSAVVEHRNAVEPRIDTTISSRLASDDNRLDNLDAKISSRSSHTPADVWTYPTRELTNPDNYKADISDLARESTVQAIKSQTDKLQFNTDSDVKATLDGERVRLTSDIELLLNIILGLVQHNYRLFNTTYTEIKGMKKLTSATVKVYSSREDCENDVNPLKVYDLQISYDEDGCVVDYRSVES